MHRKHTEEYNMMMDDYGANHYARNGKKIIMERAKGIYLIDTNGNVYIDAAAGFSSMNLGHNHPRINATGHALYTVDEDGWGIVNVVPNTFPTVAQALFLQHACSVLHADKGLLMNTGTEGVETAIKLMRKWGYTKKGITPNEALIIVCEGNFHGRSTTIIGFSSESLYREQFGPFDKGFVSIPFDDLTALENVLEKYGERIAGFLVEPIQGERGIRIPHDGYLHSCYEMCKKHNVLFVADEIQTGLGRTGKMLACEHEHVIPDIFILAKSLGAGRNAVSAVFSKNEYMLFEPGEHGSTYGGNASSMMLSLEVLKIIEEEELCNRSALLGYYLREKLRKGLLRGKTKKAIKDIRGRGLMIAIEPEEFLGAETVIHELLKEGVLTKSAHNVIRITPPLIISKKECAELSRRIVKTFTRLVNK